MKPSASEFDLDYLRRVKDSTPEQRLDWLAAAQELALVSGAAKNRSRISNEQ